MKGFKNILVLENDPSEIPNSLEKFLNKQINTDKEYWFNFNTDLNNDKEKSFKKLELAGKESMLICAPSFIGYDNDFDTYLLLLLKLKDLNIQLDLCIMFDNKFIKYLQDFLNQDCNENKRKVLQDMLKTVIDYHRIREIKSIDNLYGIEIITWELLNN